MCMKSACSEHFPWVILVDFSGYTLPETNIRTWKKMTSPKLERNLPRINFQGLFLLVSGMVKGARVRPMSTDSRATLILNLEVPIQHSIHMYTQASPPQTLAFFRKLVNPLNHHTKKTSKKMSPRIHKNRFDTTNSEWNISTSTDHTHRIHAWYVYTHLVDSYGKCI